MPTPENSRWFHRGKEARANGLPCTVRALPANRQPKSKTGVRNFIDGWQYQDAQMATSADGKMCRRMTEYIRRSSCLKK